MDENRTQPRTNGDRYGVHKTVDIGLLGFCRRQEQHVLGPYRGEYEPWIRHFPRISGGDPLWIAQAATLEEAREKLNTLAHTLPAKYFIRDATTAQIVDRSDVDESRA